MKLKTYQQDTLDTLRRFLEATTVAGPKSAYEKITAEEEVAQRLRGYGGTYEPLAELPDVPYVCIRLPTGGGKTVLAAHAIRIARETVLEREYPVVLWLVPSNTIRTQTVDALKNTRHPYRQALDEAFAGRVRIFDIADFTQILPHDLKSNLCVVVGTIQTLRVDRTEGRKVYAHHEMLEPHFTSVSPGAAGLERMDACPNKGDVKFSFANLLHMHRPLMIVDEAHNAVTGLTRVVQARVNPSAIIEFTATPRRHSNTLYSVPAQVLKSEEMVKLPIVLSEHGSWREAITGALASRQALEDEAAKDRDYIRPIVLFQAQNRDQEIPVDVLKKHLVEAQGIDEREIAVATGDQRDLDGMDLVKADCPVKYVITVKALKEGWDCSFAYVFCSVANISSALDVEQLLGRVLRMPYAKRRKNADLNKAYANVASASFSEAAAALKDRLVKMGFDEDEAAENIEPAQEPLDGGLWGSARRPKPKLRVKVSAPATTLKKLEEIAPGIVSIREDEEGSTDIEITGVPSAEVFRAISNSLPADQSKAFQEQAAAYQAENKHLASPAEQGATFVVPALVAVIQGELELIDPLTYIEFADFRLAKHRARLERSEFDIVETADVFEIDLDGDRLRYRYLDSEDQLNLDLVEVEGWSQEQLVAWLTRHVQDPHIGHGEMVGWLSNLITYLTGPRGLTIAALNRCKFPLMRKVRDKIEALKRRDMEAVYQMALFDDGAAPELSEAMGFKFRVGMFADVRRYSGAYDFNKHFLGPLEVPYFDGADRGEEFQCAQALDSMHEVQYWLRNVAQHRDAFWLPRKSQRFYPDFVAKLKDGRTLVVEYKGQHLATSEETDEKRVVGHLWQKSSGGTGVFITVEKVVDDLDVRKQLQRAIA